MPADFLLQPLDEEVPLLRPDDRRWSWTRLKRAYGRCVWRASITMVTGVRVSDGMCRQ